MLGPHSIGRPRHRVRLCREASPVYCYGIRMAVLSSLLPTLQLHWLIENRYAAFQWQVTVQLLLLNSSLW
jgi:hypothetical protein